MGRDSHPPPRSTWLAPDDVRAPVAVCSTYQSDVHSSTLPAMSTAPNGLTLTA